TAELSIIAGLRHKNLVQLLSWCVEKGELLLVYEFMPHSSLDKFLHHNQDSSSSSGGGLSWSQRRNVAVGYLHQECERAIGDWIWRKGCCGLGGVRSRYTGLLWVRDWRERAWWSWVWRGARSGERAADRRAWDWRWEGFRLEREGFRLERDGFRLEREGLGLERDG
ncbi:Probable L-type lectin-domain containing receptor kinase S.7, partial [Linum perenne]